MAGAADRNLLFGILAVQLDFVSSEQLIAGMNAWVLNKERPLGVHLVEARALAADALALIDALVDKHVEQHGGQVEQSLAALSSATPLRQELVAVADADLQTSLARVLAPTPKGDRHATLVTPRPKDNPAAGRFQILRPHAAGGLGKVSVARDAELNREVALKELHDRHADNPDSRARFLQEAEITGGLEHPGVVPIYGLGQYADGRPFYAMRFIRGDSLAQAIDRFHREAHPKWSHPADVLQLRRLLARFLDVCNAMDYAHSRGVLHRDLKPGNIMLGQYGETLVVDWGLAKPLGAREDPTRMATDATVPMSHEAALTPQSGSGSAPTQMGAAIGTPAYMSPEQAAGRLDQLGPTCDVYGLGATLYVLLTGRAPQEDDDLGIVLQRVQRGEFTAPRTLKPMIPRALEAICLKAMALEPTSRYPSARRLADDIEAWLADEPITAMPESVPTRSFRWVKKHRTLVTSGAAMVVVALLALAAGNVQLRAVNERERDAKNAAIAAQKEAEAAQAEAERQTARNEELLALARKSLERYKTLSESEEFNRYGMEKLRSDLLEAALDFYATLADQTGESEAARADRGDALYRLGWTYSQLGRLDQARAAFDTSLAIFRQLEKDFPANLLYARSAASTVVSLAEMLHNARDSAAASALFAESRQRIQSLRDREPENLDAKLRLAYLTTLEAGQLWQLGKFEGAAGVLNEGIELLKGIELASLEPLQSRNVRYRLARALRQLAAIETDSLWRFPAARQHLNQAAELMRNVYDENPQASDVGYSLVQILRNSGYLYAREHFYENARRDYLEGTEVLTKIEDRHPQVPHYRQEMAEMLHALGTLHRPLEEGDMSPEALARLESAVKIGTQLVEQYPLQIERRLSLARYQSSVAEAYLLRQRPDDADRAFDSALKLLSEAGDAGDNVDVLESLGEMQYTIAEQLGDVGRDADAHQMLDAAEANLEKLIAISPQYGEAYLSLWNVFIERSNCFNREGRLVDALAELNRIAGMSDKMKELTEASWMRAGAQAVTTLSQTLHWGYLKRIRDGGLNELTANGKYEAAGEQARRLPALTGEASDHYVAAKTLAYAATAANVDNNIPKEGRSPLVDGLAVDAVKQLTTAWEKGYLRRRNGSLTGLLRSNPDLGDLNEVFEFGILRDRSDYAALVKRIETEKPPARGNTQPPSE